MNKISLLKITLFVGGLYYIMGAIVHFFGLTVFPFYDGRLYSPYHDTVLALVGIVLSLFLFTASTNPQKHDNIVKLIIASGIIAILFSIWIIFKIDFVTLGVPDKKFQTIVEIMLLVGFTGLLAYLRQPLS